MGGHVGRFLVVAFHFSSFFKWQVPACTALWAGAMPEGVSFCLGIVVVGTFFFVAGK